MKGPVFLFACGPRCGSTWVQRCLNSSGEILLWGETRLLRTLAEHQAQEPWTQDQETEGFPEHNLHKFRRTGGDMWTALLFPFRSDLESAWAEMMERALAQPARREGFSRWGTKEVHWGLEDRSFVLRHWPEARILYLTRNFPAAYASAITTGWWEARRDGLLHQWIYSSSSLCELLSSGRMDPERERWARYEDLLEQGPHALHEWCELPPPTEDALSRRFSGGHHRELTPDERDSVEPYLAQIGAISERLGYIGAAPPKRVGFRFPLLRRG
jgi:hypothetical protein